MHRCLVPILVALVAPAAAQTPEDESAMKAAQAAENAGRYLEAATLLRPHALKPDGRIRDEFAWSQWSNAVGWMTAEPPPSAEPPDPLDDSDRRDSALIPQAMPRDAIAEIVARARTTRIVILNENHDVPRTRAFALDVARALRPLGYSVLAAETFSNYADPAAYTKAFAKIAADRYLRQSSGHYTHDPVFADFVRQSLHMGYRPVAYEIAASIDTKDVSEQIAQREQAQTDYLVARAVKAYPDAKILIHVGFSHVAEEPLQHDGKPILWMAARLKRATGIDPLTIDQTVLLNGAPGTAASAAIGRAGGRSVVFFDRDRPVTVGQYAGKVDLEVAHPVLPRIDGRPGWLVGMGRTPMAIPDALLPHKGDRLVQAFVATEGDGAIPVDQVLVTAGTTPPKLMVPPVPVRITYQDPPSAP